MYIHWGGLGPTSAGEGSEARRREGSETGETRYGLLSPAELFVIARTALEGSGAIQFSRITPSEPVHRRDDSGERGGRRDDSRERGDATPTGK